MAGTKTLELISIFMSNDKDIAQFYNILAVVVTFSNCEI